MNRIVLVFVLVCFVTLDSFAVGGLKNKYFDEVRVARSDMMQKDISKAIKTDYALEQWARTQLKEYGMLADEKTAKEDRISVLHIKAEQFRADGNTIFSIQIQAYSHTKSSLLYPILLYADQLNYGVLDGDDIEPEIKNDIKRFIQTWALENAKK